MKDLIDNGVDERKRIIGSKSPHPVLFNLPLEFIERFRDQLQLIDVQFEGDPEVIRKAVWSCYQEEPVDFRGYSLYDIGAYPADPLSERITWRVTQPLKPLILSSSPLIIKLQQVNVGCPPIPLWYAFTIKISIEKGTS